MRDIALFGIGLVIGYWLNKTDRICPREIAGWDCKGDRCDHSKEAVRMALRRYNGF